MLTSQVSRVLHLLFLRREIRFTLALNELVGRAGRRSGRRAGRVGEIGRHDWLGGGFSTRGSCRWSCSTRRRHRPGRLCEFVRHRLVGHCSSWSAWCGYRNRSFLMRTRLGRLAGRRLWRRGTAHTAVTVAHGRFVECHRRRSSGPGWPSSSRRGCGALALFCFSARRIVYLGGARSRATGSGCRCCTGTGTSRSRRRGSRRGALSDIRDGTVRHDEFFELMGSGQRYFVDHFR